MIHAPLDLPVGWQVDLIDSLARRGTGHTPDKNRPDFWNGGIKWVSLADSGKLDRIFICETDKEISEAGIRNSSAVKHPAGTVILSRDAGVGKSAIIASEMAVSQHFIAWYCGSHLDNVFLYYWLQSMKPEFERIAVGSTIKTIGLRYFETLKIAYPPLSEQRKIAEILLTWDEAIAIVEQLITALQRRKKGLMQRLLTGQVRFPEFEDAPWEEVELGDHLTPVVRAEPVEAGKAYRLIGVRLYLAGAHIHDVVPGDKIVSQALSRIEENDILYNKMWVSKAAFAVARKEHAGAYGSGEYPQFIAGDGIDVRFIEYAFHDPRFLHDAKALCRGTTGRIRLHPDDFLRLRMRMPSRSEQGRITQVLQVADQEIDAMKQYLDGLRLQKKGLMQCLLTGQVRVYPEEHT